MPPPPVAGAPVGFGLAGGTGVRVVGPAAEVEVAVLAGVAVLVAACPVAVGEGLPEWLAVVPGDAFDVPVFVFVEVDDGVYIAGAVDDGELVHAETTVETKIIKMTQLTTVSLALPTVPGVVMRTFMKPPYMPGERQGSGRPYR